MTNIFQWLGEITTDGDAYIQCLRRDYDISVPTADLVFEPTEHLLESIIRRVFEAEAKTTLNILAAKYNSEKKDELEELIKRHDEEGAKYFSEHFMPYQQRESKRSRGGYVLLQPFTATRSEPPLNIAGNTFEADGSQVSPRMRLLVECDKGFVPLCITPAATPLDESNTATAWTDFRMVAGSLNQASVQTTYLIKALSNMLISKINFHPRATLPTILDASILDNYKELECQSLMYSSTERLIRDVNIQIEKGAMAARSELKIQNMKRVTEQARNQFASDETILNAIQMIDIELDKLSDDPILFVMGPVLSQDQNSEIKSDSSVRLTYIPNDVREHMFPGFDSAHFLYAVRPPESDTSSEVLTIDEDGSSQELGNEDQQLGELDDEDQEFGESEDYGAQYAPTFNENILKFSTIAQNSGTSINTLYNLFINDKTKHMLVRLSQWTNALATVGPAVNALAEVEPSVPSITRKRWMSDVVKPNIEARFRAHIIIPPESTDGLVADVIDDNRYLKFEKHLHEGDTSTYVRDVVNVIKLALEFIFVEARDVRSEMNITLKPVADLYSHPENGPQSFIPFFDMPRKSGQPYSEYETVDVSSGPTIQVPSFRRLDGTHSVSAASSFLAEYMGIAATTPMKAAYPDREMVSQFLAASSPIAVTNKSVRDFINRIIKDITPEIETKFKNCLMFKNDESNDYTEHIPFSCTFDRTESTRFKYSSGSEVTQVVEGMMMAIHLANSLSNASSSATETPVISGMNPIPLPLAASDIECKSRAVNMNQVTPSLILKTGTDIINPSRYARFLEMTSPNTMNNAGNCVFSSGLYKTPPIKGVVGSFDNRFKDESPFNFTTNNWFPTDACRIKGIKYSLYKSTNITQDDSIIVTSSSTISRLAAWKVEEGQVSLETPGEPDTYSNAFVINLASIVGQDVQSTLVFDIKQSHDYSYTNQTEYMSRKYINLPLWTNTTLVGFAVFSKMSLTVTRDRTNLAIRIRWNKTLLDRIVCLQRGAVTKITSPLGSNITYWAFASDVLCGLKLNQQIQPLIMFSRLIPIWQTTKDVALIFEKNSTYDVDTRSPMAYSITNKTKIDIRNLKKMLVEGLTGIHFSRLKNGPHTDFAVAVGTTAENLRRSLTTHDIRRSSPNCVDTGESNPVAIVLNELYNIHMKSPTRSTDIPLVSPVHVVVRGPGPTAQPTRCIVSGKGIYVKRTSQFYVIESALINRLKTTVSSSFDTHHYTNNIGAVILRHPEHITTIDSILHLIHQSASPSIITRLIIAVATSTKIEDQTGRPRDRRALDMLNSKVDRATNDVLMCPLKKSSIINRPYS